ncbi:MAG: replication initiator, partial [Acidimicrobiia bacterium]
YSSSQELDGYTWVRCGDRRAARCESCSREYKGDAWHLLSAGLVGGKGAPETVVGHPTSFVTLTPPSFGPVHGLRQGAPCRARRDRPVCPHGRPLYCLHRHAPGDQCLGEPLCADCYDYLGHVLWQWHAPELWRRFRIALDRRLARIAGVRRRDFPKLARLAYTKVVEFQARGLIHVHAVMRLDGPTGPESPPGVDLDALQLGAAIDEAARTLRLNVSPDGHEPVALRWGDQIDTRPITLSAGRDDQAGDVHPEMVAAYLAKYLTKSTEDFGLDGHGRVHGSADARYLGASAHAIRIIETAEQLAATGGDYERLADRYGTLGYRGHVMTKTRRYSTTFGALRQARAEWRQRGGRPAPPEGDEQASVVAGHHDDPDGDAAEVVIERNWRFAGVGFLDLDAAARALTSAALAREHR